MKILLIMCEVTAIIAFIGIVFAILSYKFTHAVNYDLDIPGMIFGIFSSLAAIITFGMVVVICIVQLDASGEKIASSNL